MMINNEVLIPVWPAPSHVHGIVTTKAFGNLGLHVGDDPSEVSQHRRKLQKEINSTIELQWLQQVHGNKVCLLGSEIIQPLPSADAIWTQQKDKACVIMTADCLPVFFCDEQGTEIAAAHAGWRGLMSGVLDSTVEHFKAPRKSIMAWLGPSIGPCHFEVGEEVRQAFLTAGTVKKSVVTALLNAFLPSNKPGYWMADLYQLARIRLKLLGVKNVYGGGWCTYCSKANDSSNQFYSHRRDDKRPGRLASVIWLEANKRD